MRNQNDFPAIFGLLVLLLGTSFAFENNPHLGATEDRDLRIANLAQACVEWYDRYYGHETLDPPSPEQAPSTGGTLHSNPNSLAYAFGEADAHGSQQSLDLPDRFYRAEHHSQPHYPLSNDIDQQSQPQALTGGNRLPEPLFDTQTARAGNQASRIVIGEERASTEFRQTSNLPKPFTRAFERTDNEDIHARKKFARLSDPAMNDAAGSSATQQRSDVRVGRGQSTSASADKDAANKEASSSSLKSFLGLDLRSSPTTRLSPEERWNDAAFICHVQSLRDTQHTERAKKETRPLLQQAFRSSLIQELSRNPQNPQGITSEMAQARELADRNSPPLNPEIVARMEILFEQLWHMNRWFLYLFGISASDERFVNQQERLFSWVLQYLQEPYTNLQRSSATTQVTGLMTFDVLQEYIVRYLTKPMVSTGTKIWLQQVEYSVPRQAALGTQVALHILGFHYKTKNQEKWKQAFKIDFIFWKLFKQVFNCMLLGTLDTFLEIKFPGLKKIPASPW